MHGNYCNAASAVQWNSIQCRGINSKQSNVLAWRCSATQCNALLPPHFMILYTICHNCYDDYPHGGADVPTTTSSTSTGMPTIVTRMAYYLVIIITTASTATTAAVSTITDKYICHHCCDGGDKEYRRYAFPLPPQPLWHGCCQ